MQHLIGNIFKKKCIFNEAMGVNMSLLPALISVDVEENQI